MHRNMQALKEVGYQHMCVPDHAPGHNEPAAGRQAFDYEFGCIGLCPRRAFSGIVAPVLRQTKRTSSCRPTFKQPRSPVSLNHIAEAATKAPGLPLLQKKPSAGQTDSACPLCAYRMLILWGTAHPHGYITQRR